MHQAMQRLQHQTVAAERHHYVGVFRRVVGVDLCELLKRLLGLDTGTRHEGDTLVLGRDAHLGSARVTAANARGPGRARCLVYTSFDPIVEAPAPDEVNAAYPAALPTGAVAGGDADAAGDQYAFWPAGTLPSIAAASERYSAQLVPQSSAIRLR